MKDFFRNNGVLILIAAILLALVTAVVSALLGGGANPLANLVNIVTTPVRSGISAVAGWAEESGLETEYILCSGDPDSLDAVVLPRLGAAVVDGTAPHGTAPLGHPAKKVSICKGLQDRLLDGTSTGRVYLGHFYWTSIQK